MREKIGSQSYLLTTTRNGLIKISVAQVKLKKVWKEKTLNCKQELPQTKATSAMQECPFEHISMVYVFW